jgi:ribonuclease P protein component
MRKGRRIQVDSIRCVFLPNQLGHARLGMAVSRKYGNAVQRNRFKRQVRNMFRQHAIRDLGVDLLIVPLVNADGISDPAGITEALFGKLMHKLVQS